MRQIAEWFEKAKEIDGPGDDQARASSIARLTVMDASACHENQEPITIP